MNERKRKRGMNAHKRENHPLDLSLHLNNILFETSEDFLNYTTYER